MNNWPKNLTALARHIASELPAVEAQAFFTELQAAAPTDAKALARVVRRADVLRLTAFAAEHPDVARGVNAILALLERNLAGDEPSAEEWQAARAAVWSVWPAAAVWGVEAAVEAGSTWELEAQNLIKAMEKSV